MLTLIYKFKLDSIFSSLSFTKNLPLSTINVDPIGIFSYFIKLSLLTGSNNPNVL